VHSLYVAFYTCRILTHSNTFSAWCILNVLHSTCDAFMCIIVYFSELDAVIVSGGKTVDQIKAMHVLEKKKHADVCNKNRAISRRNPSPRWAARPSTPRSFPSWAGCSCSCMHENACECTHIHTNAYECILMQKDTYECIRMHTRVCIHE
jgi:hypothetical protein